MEVRMIDDTTPRHPKDRRHIDLEEEEDVRYWTELFGVTEAELRDAVHTGGVQIDEVRSRLGKT
jgi:hypothetical protein